MSVSVVSYQQTLDGRRARAHPPSDKLARVLDRLGEEAAEPLEWDEAVRWTHAARSRETTRVLAWIERAAAEGVLE